MFTHIILYLKSEKFFIFFYFDKIKFTRNNSHKFLEQDEQLNLF